MSTQTICVGMCSVTFSLVSEGGAMHSGLQDGQTMNLFGPEAAHVNRSPYPDWVRASMTRAIFGQSSPRSSSSLNLQLSLENRLRDRLNGSRICTVIWKEWTAPWGACLSRPRAQVPRIDVTAHGLLPTPSGTSNHGKNHVAGRIDEWGGSSNYFRGTPDGNKHLPGFELWTMGYPDQWRQLMPPATPSSRKRRQSS